jgi:7-cyano-7-deazaguanine synthase
VTKRALLLSGGMDSTAVAWAIRPDLAITIDYGQLAAAGEIRAAKSVSEALNLRHRLVSVNCREVGSGDLAGTAASAFAPVSEWWPFRNQLLLTLAAAVALQEGVTTLVLGVVATDGCHADGRIEFFEDMRRVLRGQEGNLKLEVPAITDSTAAFCRRTCVPREILAWAHSCHVWEYACGVCRGCMKHREAMRELGYGEY